MYSSPAPAAPSSPAPQSMRNPKDRPHTHHTPEHRVQPRHQVEPAEFLRVIEVVRLRLGAVRTLDQPADRVDPQSAVLIQLRVEVALAGFIFASDIIVIISSGWSVNSRYRRMISARWASVALRTDRGRRGRDRHRHRAPPPLRSPASRAICSPVQARALAEQERVTRARRHPQPSPVTNTPEASTIRLISVIARARGGSFMPLSLTALGTDASRERVRSARFARRAGLFTPVQIRASAACGLTARPGVLLRNTGPRPRRRA